MKSERRSHVQRGSGGDTVRWTLVGVLVISLSYACGGASAPARSPATPAPARAQGAPQTAAAPATAAPATAADPPPSSPHVTGQIARSVLVPILDAGLGRFLQGVRTEAVLDHGRFVGFRILSLYPDDPRFAHAGLHAGDVITRVNGQPIEHPEQALTVWNGLRVASELMIDYLRDGSPREIRFEIAD